MVLGKLHKCDKIATTEEKVLIPHFFGKKKINILFMITFRRKINIHLFKWIFNKFSRLGMYS